MLKTALFLCCQCEEWPDPEHRVSAGVNGRPSEEVWLRSHLLHIKHVFASFSHRCSDVHRCEETTSSPAVSNSIGEGIIEEEEDEEEESNKKRMKEDDQEVLVSLYPHLFHVTYSVHCVQWKGRVETYLKGLSCSCRWKRKASSPGEWNCRRQKSTWTAGSEACLPSFSPALYQNCFCWQVRSLILYCTHETNLDWKSHLFRWNTYNSSFIPSRFCHWLNNFTPDMLHCAGVDRLDKDLTIGQMQGEEDKRRASIFFILFVTVVTVEHMGRLRLYSRPCLSVHREISDASPPSVWSRCPRGRTWKSKWRLPEHPVCLISMVFVCYLLIVLCVWSWFFFICC